MSVHLAEVQAIRGSERRGMGVAEPLRLRPSEGRFLEKGRTSTMKPTDKPSAVDSRSRSAKRIGVLLGGLGPEREVSIQSGEAVAKALEDKGYPVVKIFVDHDVDRVLRQTPIDVAFNALHGPYGEDGCIQGLLEMLRIPYTGSGVLASALAMDKVKSKELFRLYNVSTPPYYTVRTEQLAELDSLHGSFGYPVFVKPRRGGSTIGASRAKTPTELREAIELALRFDDVAIVERYIAGRELAVGLLDGKALGAIEIEPASAVYDYQSKYQSTETRYHYPARVSPTLYQGILNLAERANRAVGGTGATRVDLLVTEGDNEYILEVNTSPGMTATSLLPKIAAANGIDFGALCERAIGGAGLGNVASSARSDVRESVPQAASSIGLGSAAALRTST